MRNAETGEESLSLGVFVRNNSACRKVTGDGWEFKGCRVISRNSYPECEELLLRGRYVPSYLGHVDRVRASI